MPLSVTPPLWLDRLDCAHITFVLTLVERVDLPTLALLQLRREFSAVHKELESQQGAEIARLVGNLLFPQPATDPVVQRQVQKPSAAVVFSPEAVPQGNFAEGHQFQLPALFIGDGVVAIEAFVSLLRLLGQRGIHKGQGRFHVAVMKPVINNGDTNSPAVLTGSVTPNIVPLSWLLEQRSHPENQVKLEVITPMRLIKNGKPLFKLVFKDFFSALRRRVSHLAIAHGEAVINSADDELKDLAATIVCREECLHWQDWRRLDQGRKEQGIGGLTGTLDLSGDALAELWWLLELGALLHVGKGASFGFGRFRLVKCS